MPKSKIDLFLQTAFICSPVTGVNMHALLDFLDNSRESREREKQTALQNHYRNPVSTLCTFSDQRAEAIQHPARYPRNLPRPQRSVG